MNCKQYITETKVFTQSGSTDTNCNSLIFVNTGTSNVNLDGLILTPNQSLNITGNENEINVKIYYFNFTGAGTNALTIIYKRYI